MAKQGKENGDGEEKEWGRRGNMRNERKKKWMKYK